MIKLKYSQDIFLYVYKISIDVKFLGQNLKTFLKYKRRHKTDRTENVSKPTPVPLFRDISHNLNKIIIKDTKLLRTWKIN